MKLHWQLFLMGCQRPTFVGGWPRVVMIAPMFVCPKAPACPEKTGALAGGPRRINYGWWLAAGRAGVDR